MNYLDQNGDANVGKIVGHFVLAMIALIVFFGSWTVVGAGQRGVVVRLGKVQGRILDEGLHFKLPLVESIEKINVRTQALVFDNVADENDNEVSGVLSAASKDLQDVAIAVVANYRPRSDKVNSIYQQYKDGYVPTVLEPLVRDTIKTQSAQYTAAELVQKRAEFAEVVFNELSRKFIEKDTILETVNIVNFKFSDSFNQAIESKVRAEQEAQTAKNQLERIKFEAEQRVTEARAEAEAIRIQAQAITQQGGREYVELKRIEKWNGVYPTHMFGNATPLVNI